MKIEEAILYCLATQNRGMRTEQIAEMINRHRHTFATLQIAAGTDIYTVSKILTHRNVSTTQIYAELVNEKKREPANRISLKQWNVTCFSIPASANQCLSG